MTFTNPGTQPKNVHTITEAGKTAVWCFGRMNPPHFGHEGLIKLVETTAAGKHADWFIFVSKSQDKNKNPLPYAEKVNWIYTLFPQTKGHLVEDVNLKTFMQAAAWIYAQGYRSVVFVAGEDDMVSMRTPLEQYNGKQVAHGFYQFEPFSFVESPRLTTATNAREAAKSGNEEAFYAATRVSETATVNNKTLFQAVRVGMGLPLEVRENVAAKGLDKPTPSVADLVNQHRVSRQKVNHALGQGIRVEMEHTNDVDVAREIALDHLAERLDYYDRLREIETEDQGATSPTSQLGDRAVAVNPFDYYTPFIGEELQLDEVNLKSVRNFVNDPRLDMVNMGWELEMIWPDHDDGRNSDDEYETESEPDFEADESIDSDSVGSFRRDIMNFFVGDHNGTRDVRNVLDGFIEDYHNYLRDKWDELYGDEDEDVRREVADRMESGKDEAIAKDEAKDDWVSDNQDDMLADYLIDDVETNTMYDFMDNTGNDLNWPVYTESENYGSSDKGELTREDLKNMFQSEFGDMLTQDGFKVQAIDSPHKNKRMDTWYFEPDGSLNPQDQGEGGVELTTPPMPYKRSMEYLNKVFAWAKSHRAWTGSDGDTGFHMSFSLPKMDMQNVDWVKMILMGGDDRVLRDFDRWAGGNNNWAKSALKHIRDATAKGGDINSDLIIDAIRTGLTPDAKREAMKYMSRGKYTSIHPKGGGSEEDSPEFTYVEFRSAGGDALGQIEKVRMAALQYARSIILATDPAADRQEYAKKLYKMVAKVKSDEPGLRALRDYADGKIDKDILKFKLGKAAVARGQKPKYQPSGNVYVFKIKPGHRYTGPDIEIIAPTLMAAIPQAQQQARNNNAAPSYYYQLVTEPGEKIFMVDTEKGIGPADGGWDNLKRAGVIVLAANGAEAADTASSLLGLPVALLTARDVTGGLDLDDLTNFVKSKWHTKEQIVAAKAAQDKAEADKAAATQQATSAGGQKYKIVTAQNGNPPAYSPSTHTQIANSPEDAVTKFMTANQIAEPFRQYYRAVPADQPAAAPQPNPAATQAGTFIITYLSPTGRQDQTAYDTNSAREAEILFRLQHPASYQIVGIEQQGGQTESLAESLLAEVNMGPGALADFAKSDLGKSIRVGFEAEMLVPDLDSKDDDDYDYDDEYEPDYDADERIRFDRSWRRQVENFWRDADHNIHSRRDIDNAIEQMDEQYQEHVDNELSDYLASDEGIKAIMDRIREDNADATDLTDEQIMDREDYMDLYNDAEDNVRDDWTTDYMRNDQNFIDWADGNSLSRMSGFANRFNLDWPHMTQVSSSRSRGDRSMDSIAKDFSKYSGYASDSGSYSTSPDDTTSIFKPDSSIKRLDLPDSYAGVEFASAFMPLPETMDMLQKFYKWAGSIGAEANASCGFHMGVSIPQHTRDTVDVMKFILFLGDEKVLADFGREASQWCKSSMAEIRKRIRSGNYDPKSALEEFRSGLNSEAAKMMKRRLLPAGDRYVSVNYKENYIEIRSGGGNFFEQKDLIVNTMLRYVRVLGLAASPEEAQQEYAKKLYKVLSKHIRDESPDTVQYFAQYAAGQITKTALKSLVKQLQNTRDGKADSEIKYVIRKRDTGQVYDTLTAKNDPAAMEIYRAWLQRSNRGGWDYELIRADDQKLVTVNWKLYKVLRRADDFEVHQFLAQDANIAQVTMERWARATRSDPDNYTVVVANQQPSQQSQNDDLSDVDFGAWEPEPEPQRPTAQPAQQTQADPNAWSPNARVAYQLLDRTGRAIAYFTDGTRMPTNSIFYAANSDDAGRRAADLDRLHGLPMGYLVRPFGRNESTEPRSLYQSIVEQEQLSELTQNPGAFRKFLNSEVANQITMGFEAEMCVKGLDLNSRVRPNIPAGVDAEAVFPFDEEGQTRYYEFWLANGANTRSEVSVGLDKVRRRLETWMRAHAEAEEVTPAHWKRFLRGGGHRNWTNMLELNRELELEWPYGDSSDTLTRDKLKRDFQNSTGYQAELHGGYHSQAKPNDKFVFEYDGSIRPRSGDGGQELVSHAMPLPEAMAALDKMFAWANDKGYVYTNGSTGFHVNVGMKGLDTGKLDKMKLLLLLGDKKILTDFGREANDFCSSMLDRLENTFDRRTSEQSRNGVLVSLKIETWQKLRDLANYYVERAHGGEKYVSVNFKEKYIEFRSPGGDWMNNQANIRDTVLRISQAYAVSASPTEGQQDYLKKAYKFLSGMSSDHQDSMQLFVDYNMGKITAERFAAELARRQGRTRNAQPQPNQQAAQQPASRLATSMDTGEYSEGILARLPRDMTIAQGWGLYDQGGDQVDEFSTTARGAVSIAQDYSSSNPEYTFSLEADRYGQTFATFGAGRVYFGDIVLRTLAANEPEEPAVSLLWDVWFMNQDPDDEEPSEIRNRVRADSAEAAMASWNQRYPRSPALRATPSEGMTEAKFLDVLVSEESIELAEVTQNPAVWDRFLSSEAAASITMGFEAEMLVKGLTHSGELTRKRLAQMFSQSTGYKIKVGQSASKDAFGLVNDGSLEYKQGDGGVELISYAMPLPEAMQALNKTFQWARDSKLIYTNSSSGFHVNVGIKGSKPKDIDKLKLLLLVGDQAILKEFGRMKNEYCESMLLRLKKALKWKRTDKDPNTDSGGWWGSDDSDVTRSDDEINATMAALRKETWAGLRNIANTLVDNIHDDNKYVSINAHNNYIEFRSPGGNWMPKWDQIYYTVLRVTHAYALAADPVEGKQDYLKKAYKILSTGTEKNDELKTFIDFSMGKVDAVKLKKVLTKKHTQGPIFQTQYGIQYQPPGGKKSYVHQFNATSEKEASKYAWKWVETNLPGNANLSRWQLHALGTKTLDKLRKDNAGKEPTSSAARARATQQSARTNIWMVSHSDGQGDFMHTPVTATTAAQARTIFQHNYGNQLAIYDVEPYDPDMHGDIDDEGHLQQNDQEHAAANMWDVWFMHQDPDDDVPSEISNRVRADSAEAATADWNRRHPRSPALRVTPSNESISEAKSKPKKPKTIVDGAIKTLVGKGRSEDEAIADLKKEVDKKFYTEEEQIIEGFIAEATFRLDNVMPDGDITYTKHYNQREHQRDVDMEDIISLSRAAAGKYAAELINITDDSFVIKRKDGNGMGMAVIKSERPDGSNMYRVATVHANFLPKLNQTVFYV